MTTVTNTNKPKASKTSKTKARRIQAMRPWREWKKPAKNSKNEQPVIKLTLQQAHIVYAIGYNGVATDEEIRDTYRRRDDAPPASDSSLRTRRKELEDQGIVVFIGLYKTRSNGRKAKLFKLGEIPADAIVEVRSSNG